MLCYRLSVVIVLCYYLRCSVIIVLFYVLIVCTVTLPPGVNPIAVDKNISFSSVTQQACSSLDHTYLDTSHAVGLLWTRDRSVAVAATLTHNMHKRETSMPSTITFLCLALTLQWRTRCSVRNFSYSYTAGVGAPYAVNALMGGIN